MHRRVSGDEHLDTVNSMSTLAGLYLNQGRYDEAEPLYLDTLKSLKRVLGDEHPDTLASVKTLAELYNEMGRGDDARPLVAELLSSQRKRAEASSEADASNGYAWTALTCDPADLRDPPSALRFALDANEKTGYQNPYYLHTLSLAYHLTGNTAKAIENQRKAIALLPEGDSTNRESFEEALAGFEAARDAEGQ